MSKGRNKRRERTEQLKQSIRQHIIAEEVDNAIEQQNFDKLVKQGVIVECEAFE